MNILIINGSPTGDDSITLQTMLYIRRFFPSHEYRQLNVGRQIKSLEKDFATAKELLAEAELLVFCYPVYTFLVPAQLHRFLELIRENGAVLTGKYATQLSTSKHFYDTTAHAFIRENCGDLGLRYIRGLSADMEDLLSSKGREEALAFFRHVLWSAEHGVFEAYAAPARCDAALTQAALPEAAGEKTKDGRVAVVADLTGDDGTLAGMIERFRAVCTYPVELVDLGEFSFAGGCLGCFHCAQDGRCVYRDGFDVLLRERIQTADATVYAFTVRDHSMGYRFKLYDDRQFCNGHRTVTMGKPLGYLVSGRISGEPNLRELIEARAQVGGNPLARIASNEGDVDREIDLLAAELDYAITNHFRQPANFYGVGGMKIFRDLIYTMQGLMREDHRFYKRHGFYDFPQKRAGTILGMYLVGGMMRSKWLRKKAGNRMTEGMLMPYKRVLEKAEREAPAADQQ